MGGVFKIHGIEFYQNNNINKANLLFQEVIIILIHIFLLIIESPKANNSQFDMEDFDIPTRPRQKTDSFLRSDGFRNTLGKSSTSNNRGPVIREITDFASSKRNSQGGSKKTSKAKALDLGDPSIDEKSSDNASKFGQKFKREREKDTNQSRSTTKEIEELSSRKK